MPFDLSSYEPVEDRLREFWAEHPNGRIMTTLVSSADGDYIVRAEVWVGDGLDWPTASGLAHDSVDELPPNMRNSALEVCETSAIGRALANMGYAPKGKRPSREEMSKSSPAEGPAVTPAAGIATTAKPQPRALSSGAPAAPGGQAGGTTSSSVAGGETSAKGHSSAPAQDPELDTSPTGALGEGGPSVKSTAGSNDAAVALGPGGASSPGSTIYPLDPAKCSHRFPSGRWLKWDAEDRCPRCGTPKLVAMEGTTADLGPA